MTDSKVLEKRRLEQAAWRDKNRDHYNAWARQNHRKNKHIINQRTYWYHIKRVYNMTRDEYETLLQKQKNVCALCNGNNGGKRLHIDHDHNTGRIRGLLCAKCNSLLGLIDAVGIDAIKEYKSEKE